MDSKQLEKLLASALKDLKVAVNKMTSDTIPSTPLPRPRGFLIVKDWYFPRYEPNYIYWGQLGRGWPIKYRNHLYVDEDAAQNIIRACEGRPRLILRALRRIQAATAWCEARAEGRRRQAEEILRQQAKAVETLDAEAAMLALKEV